MKSRRIIALTAAAAVALSMSGCKIGFGKREESSQTIDGSYSTAGDGTSGGQVINSISIEDSTLLAYPKSEKADRASMEITGLDFKKEYLYWLQANHITDDNNEYYAESCASQRFSIMNYLVNEKIIEAKAKELGLDKFTTEELDSLEEEYQKQVEEQIEYFANQAEFSGLDESEITDEMRREKGEEEFDKYLANALITRDTLLEWQRSALIAEKVKDYITGDVTIDRSEAVDVYNDYIESVKEMYETDPVTYETGGNYTAFWVPEGTRQVKHILIALDEADSDEIAAMRQNGNVDGADQLRAEKLKEIEQQANDVLAELDGGADFDELIEKYSADAAASKIYPDGYTVVPDSQSFVSDFVEAAYSIEKIGDYVLAPSDYGYHIVLYNADVIISEEAEQEYIDYVEETLIENAKTNTFTEVMKQWHEEFDFEVDYDILGIVVESETAEAENSGS